MATIEDLRSWVERDLSHFSKIADHVKEKIDQFGIYRFELYTDTNHYQISARLATGKPGTAYGETYLGCVASARKPRAGETWTRGRDLADGKLTEETWRRILADIVSYEMVKVHKQDNLPAQVG